MSIKPRRVSWHDQPVVVVGMSPKYYETETAFQIYCATWLRRHWSDVRFHHSANERVGGRDGLKAKLMGQSKGFPDLVIFEIRLAIELKVGRNGLSKEQKEWLAYFRRLGWKAVVCRSVPEFLACLGEG